MSKGLVVINFKVYSEALADKGIILARKLGKVKNKKYTIILAPTLLTIKEIAARVSLPVFAQHTDVNTNGAYTGSISIDELQKIGVKGTILNHSEKKLPFSVLKKIISLCKQKRFTTIVCATSVYEAKRIARFQPTYIAYEPSELIGGNKSVCEAKPDLVIRAVEAVKAISRSTKVLCGAGVHSKEDVGHALLLGTQGVLIGHAIPKARDPEKALREMLL